MKQTLGSIQLTVEYWNRPEAEKGEKNPFMTNDPEQMYNPFIKSSKLDIPEELLPELLDYLESKGVFVGHVKGIKIED